VVRGLSPEALAKLDSWFEFQPDSLSRAKDRARLAGGGKAAGVAVKKTFAKFNL
jgi:hypothetical protein